MGSSGSCVSATSIEWQQERIHSYPIRGERTLFLVVIGAQSLVNAGDLAPLTWQPATVPGYPGPHCQLPNLLISNQIDYEKLLAELTVVQLAIIPYR